MRLVAAAGAAALVTTVVVPVAGLGGSATATPRVHRAASAHHRKPHALRVGTYDGKRGQFRTIQAAVNAAKPGDWILIAPGDYKTHGSWAPKDAPEQPAGVYVHTSHLFIRGMNRNKVIVDGTKSGPPCSTATKDQNFGPKDDHGTPLGLNGVMVWEASDVWVQNLTACNFLGGSGGNGNEIWWNDGDDSGRLGAGRGFLGSYMTTTNTYFHDESTAAQYGIFSSNWRGGTWNQSYASNFNDSGYYIGACRDVCDQVVNHAWAEYNALGYSGSNSGGSLVVKNSEFDRNEDGFDTNSQNGDNPPPQDGTCPNDGVSPITHTTSCWVFMHNYVHDNNNPNVPTAGSAAAGPVGTGMTISGGRNDTIMDNLFANNHAWGVALVPYPDSGPPCTGGTLTPAACLYDEYGDAVIGNAFKHNGGYGNPTNGDIAATNLEPDATDCFGGNVEVGGGAATTSPGDAESLYPTCDGGLVAPDLNPLFLDEVACDSGNASLAGLSTDTVCLPGESNYPRQTKVVMHALPGARAKHGRPAIENPASAGLKTMHDPCDGVPANPWCPKGHYSAQGS
ncbi:MAG TPA: hypothetical protein VHC43_16110 [Mycobacteriales bacterium]|nr:hypothetical protein [Mycobacteriales bacterium]